MQDIADKTEYLLPWPPKKYCLCANERLPDLHAASSQFVNLVSIQKEKEMVRKAHPWRPMDAGWIGE